ncbi:MAG: pilus assembly protein PilM [Candidatus Ratteibacteria bacterium]|nr:pilus assembly protein PilM [Candidatus Ratteibacteria bacterium]
MGFDFRFITDKGDKVGIDFSDNILKIAYIKTSVVKRGVISLTSTDITNLSDDEIAEIIKTSLAKEKIKNPTIIGMVSSNLAIIKNIEIPSTNPQEIKEIVQLQAARHTPYSPEEIIISYVVIGTSKSNYTRIFLVIVKQDVVRREFEIFKKAKLNVKRIIFKPDGINNIVCKILKLEEKKSPTAIIHVDKLSTDFIVSYEGKVIFTRNVSLGMQNFLQDKEKYINDFKEEIRKSIEAYQAEEIGEPIAMLVLSGAKRLYQEEILSASLKNLLNIPLEICTYDNLPISRTASEILSTNQDSSFLDVIAPLWAFEQLHIDLVPEEIKIQKAFKEKSKNIIQTGVLIAIIVFLISAILVIKIYLKELYLEKLILEYETTNKKAESLEETFKQVQLVRSYLSRRGYVLEILSQLYDLVTPEIYLHEIRFDRKGTFSIKGTSTSMSSVFSFITNMEKSEYYKDVKTNSTRKREEKGQNLVDFEIISSLEEIKTIKK